MYVCMCLCVYVCMYVFMCMYVCMYVCKHTSVKNIATLVHTLLPTHARVRECSFLRWYYEKSAEYHGISGVPWDIGTSVLISTTV